MENRPFAQVVLDKLEELDMSQRELGRRVQRHGGPTIASINYVLMRDQEPTVSMMEAVATALAMSPDAFAEWHMRKLREQLDPAKVGFEMALATLKRAQSSA